MRQPRRTTDFAGWQSEIEYLADEAERQKAHEASVKLYQREEPPVVTGRWMFCLAVCCLLGAGVIFWRILEALKP